MPQMAPTQFSKPISGTDLVGVPISDLVRLYTDLLVRGSYVVCSEAVSDRRLVSVRGDDASSPSAISAVLSASGYSLEKHDGILSICPSTKPTSQSPSPSKSESSASSSSVNSGCKPTSDKDTTVDVDCYVRQRLEERLNTLHAQTAVLKSLRSSGGRLDRLVNAGYVYGGCISLGGSRPLVRLIQPDSSSFVSFSASVWNSSRYADVGRCRVF